MAELNIPDGNGKHKRNHAKKIPVRVDLTPMVDLAFLLITFFMLTTSMLKMKAMELVMPKITTTPIEVSDCQVLNLLTDSLGRYYYWEGLECRSVQPISLTDEPSLKEKLKEKSEYLKHNCLYATGEQKNLICLIKLMPGSQYEQMVRLLDEMSSEHVPTYTIQAYSPDEEVAVNREQQKLAAK